MPKGMLLLAPHSDDASVDASVDAGGGGGTDSATGATGAARRRGGGFKFDVEVLKENEQRLFSSYDIYATLEHLMREDHGGVINHLTA